VIIVDALVVMKWFVEEELHAEAKRLKQVFAYLAAPDFMLLDVANIAWKKVRRGELAAAAAMAIGADLRRTPLPLLPTTALIDDALTMATEIDHPVYDCVYITAALRQRGICLTADRRLCTRIASTRFADHILPLAEVDAVIARFG
jgi:predicted nucleic acid-binding protein